MFPYVRSSMSLPPEVEEFYREQNEKRNRPMRVYIAGPYSNDPQGGTDNAIDAAEKVAERGHIPYIPHLTHYWEARHPHPYQFWLDYDNVFLPMCDVLLRLPGKSSGADKEVELADRLGLVIIYDITQLPIERAEVKEVKPRKWLFPIRFGRKA